MSASGTGSVSQSAIPVAQTSRKWRGIQFVLLAVAAFVCLRYSLRMPIDWHALPADLAGRLRMLAPALALYSAGMVCLFRAASLYMDWASLVKARQAAVEGRSTNGVAEIPKSARIIYRFALFLAFYMMVGSQFIRVLWPAESVKIAVFAAAAVLLLMLTGLLLQYRGQKTYIMLGDDEIGRSRQPIVISNMAIVAMTFVLSIAALFAIHRIAKMLQPDHVRTIDGAAYTLLFAAFLFVLRWFSQNARIDKAKDTQFTASPTPPKSFVSRRTRDILVLVVFETAILQLLHRTNNPAIHSAVFWGQFAVIFVVLVVLARLKQWIYSLSRAGNYDRAFYWDNMLSWIPGYGKPLKGIILFNAGQYQDALAFLKPMAFDATGKPLLATTELYCYALALENSGNCVDAQRLLDAAVNACPENSGLKVALAGCLLTQQKEADHACTLLEQALASPEGSNSSYGSRADRAMRVARYAWALGSSGRRAEAERKIQEALDLSKELRDFDIAGVKYFCGEAWRMMDETAKARSAFQEVLRLAPEGIMQKHANKALAKLGAMSPIWSS